MKIDGLTIETWFQRLNPSNALTIAGDDDGGGGEGGGGDTSGGDGDDGSEGGDGEGEGEGEGGSEGDDADGYQDDPELTDKENAAARKAHDEASPKDGDKAKAKGKEKAAPKDGDKAKDGKDKDKDALIGAPEGDYEPFDVPEGFDVDEGVKAEFDTLSRDLNLSDAGRKKLVEIQGRLYNNQIEKHAETVAEWGEKIKTDKTVGGRDHQAKIGKARAAISEFGDKELKTLLETSGYGNHPALVRFAYRAGAALGEGSVEPGGNGGGEEDAATILYGGDGK